MNDYSSLHYLHTLCQIQAFLTRHKHMFENSLIYLVAFL